MSIHLARVTNLSHRSGATLIEVMIASAIGTFIMAALASLIFYSTRSFAALTNYVDLDQKSRLALDLMTKDIRQSDKLSGFSSNRLDFVFGGGQAMGGGTVSFVYANKELVRLKTGEDKKVLLTECDSLLFSIYQRNPIGGTYDQWPVGDAGNCKVVQLHWICSRELMKQKANTESVQSAKIVIRRQ